MGARGPGRRPVVGGGTDHVSLRRHLVDQGLLSRSQGHYWRSGGWVDVLGD